jgi:hypothetical protein
MTAALCLFKMEWYSKFNGKNMGGILIPKVKTIRPKTKGKSTPTNKKKSTQRVATLEELGIPLDLNLFNQSILYSQGDKFSTVAWTTLDDCRREFFNIYHDNKEKSIEDFYKIIKDNNLVTKTDLRNFKGSNLRKLAHKFNVWNDFPNSKKGISISNDEYIEIQKEALKFKTRNQFKINSNKFYQKARVKGVIDEVCSHMISEIKNPNFWTKKRLVEEALKYSSKKEFRESEYGAYQTAHKLRILDKICAHMK